MAPVRLLFLLVVALALGCARGGAVRIGPVTLMGGAAADVWTGSAPADDAPEANEGCDGLEEPDCGARDGTR